MAKKDVVNVTDLHVSAGDFVFTPKFVIKGIDESDITEAMKELTSGEAAMLKIVDAGEGEALVAKLKADRLKGIADEKAEKKEKVSKAKAEKKASLESLESKRLGGKKKKKGKGASDKEAPAPAPVEEPKEEPKEEPEAPKEAPPKDADDQPKTDQ